VTRAGKKTKHMREDQDDKENNDPFTEKPVGLVNREEPHKGALERVAAMAKQQDALDLLEDLESCNIMDLHASTTPSLFLRGGTFCGRQDVYPSLSPSLLSPRSAQSLESTHWAFSPSLLSPRSPRSLESAQLEPLLGDMECTLEPNALLEPPLEPNGSYMKSKCCGDLTNSVFGSCLLPVGGCNPPMGYTCIQQQCFVVSM
jgi:hypothetical protein